MSNLQAEEYKSFEEYAEFQNAGYIGFTNTRKKY